jgi:5-formyltetrahydrofolate cyclo-ligase
VPSDPAGLAAWRSERRAALLAARDALPAATRARAGAAIVASLAGLEEGRAPAVVGFYWPVRGEIDVRPFVERLRAAGSLAALPVVGEPGAPLAFHRWTPETDMHAGPFGIPSPAGGDALVPDLLLIPLVGFDDAGYRLGYGGGYYDRTLAALTPPPRTIGIGYELGRMATIRPQAHDVPLDLVVTEAAVRRRGPDGLARC